MPTDSGAREPAAVWSRIREHKVLQWSLAYLGAALALAHAQELLAHNFHWPESVGHVLVGVLIVGFPVAVALAWYHGHKGVTRLSAGEFTVVSMLLVIGAGILIVLVRAPREQATTPLQPAQADGHTPAAAAVVTAAKPRLAILPFENLSPDKANEYFADGLHEEILTALANGAQGLEVISRTTMNSYRGRPITVQQIAKDLSATRVLEGSVRRDGNQVRLTLQLIDATTDEHLWAQNYDRALANTLQLESEVAAEVAAQLAVRLIASPAGAALRTPDPHAYDLYVQALGQRNAIVRVTGATDRDERLKQIESGFSHAIEADPTFAAAYAERFGPRMRAALLPSTTSTAAELAREDLEMAARLAPSDPKVLAARAWYLQYALLDWDGALRAYTAAEAAGLTDPLWLADKTGVLVNLGRRREAIEFGQRLLTLDPRNRLVIGVVAILQVIDREPAAALRTLDAALGQMPDATELRDLRASVVFDYSGALDAWNGSVHGNEDFNTKLDRLRYSHQYAAIEQLLTHAPRLFFSELRLWSGVQFDVQARGWAKLMRGDREGARYCGKELLALVREQKETASNRATLHSMVAQAFALMGERESAISAGADSLARARESRDVFNTVPTVSMQIAAVWAWSGAEDRAADLLASVADTTPGPGPARVSRDPLYSLPLAHNARYQQLVARLEAQMKATQLH